MTYIPLYLKTNACSKTLKVLNIAYTIKLMFTYFSTNTYSLHIRSISSPFKPFFMHNSNLKLMFASQVTLTKKSYANFSWELPIFSFQWVFHDSDRYAYFCIWKVSYMSTLLWRYYRDQTDNKSHKPDNLQYFLSYAFIK